MKLLGISFLVAAGCSSTGFPDVVGPESVSSAYGAPRISRVRDAGTVSVPNEGPWTGVSDGVACPGELLLIEGGGFSRQPTVLIGGRAAEVVARTSGGGILARVPRATRTGEVDVQVSTPKGAAVRRFALRRLAVALYHDHVYPLEVTDDEARALGPGLTIAGAKRLRFAPDAGVAYVLASRPQGEVIAMIDLGAAGGPALLADVALEQRAAMLTVAESAAVGLVVGEGKATLLDLSRPRAPVRYAPFDLPRELRGARAYELSPDGALVAALVAEGNRLVLAEVKGWSGLAVVNTLDLLPGERSPLARELAFASDGDTLWIVSGSNTQTLPSVQPTRLTAVRLVGVQPDVALSSHKPASRVLSIWRTTTVPGAAAPLRLTLARGQRLATGATISLPPEKAAVFFTAVNDALFKLGEINFDTADGSDAAIKLWRPSRPSMIARGDLGGGGGPLTTSPDILSAVDLTPDARLILATALKVTPSTDKKMTLDFGIAVTRTFGGNPEATFLRLAPAIAKDARPPFQIGDLKVQ